MNQAETPTPTPNPSPALSITRFPSQTTATYYLILLVFLGTLLAASLGPSPVCMAPVVLSLLVLPVRAVLSIPRRELALEDKGATKDLKARGLYQSVQDTIDALAAEAGFDRPIHLIVSSRPYEARATGSWRQHYMLLGAALLEKVAHDLEQPAHREKARALLLHEIGHHLHRDVQRIGYAGQLLKSCATLLPWWAFFLVGWLSFSLLMGEALLAFDIQSSGILTPELRQMFAPLIELSPSERAEIRNRLQTVSIGLLISFLINALLPIAAIALVLWLFFWRRMVRLQEYYADALVQARAIGWNVLAGAMGRYSSLLRPAPSEPSGIQRWFRRAFLRPLSRAGEPLALFKSPSEWAPFGGWLALHPTYRQRMQRLRQPQRFLDDWRSAAWSTAILVLALDVMLVNPLTAYHLSAYPVHISTLAIFLLTSTWLLPHLALDRPVWRPLLKSLLIIFGLRWAWLLLNTMLLLALAVLAPTFASELLNLTALSGARSVIIPETLPVSDPLQMSLAILPALAGLQLLQVAGVGLLLGIYYLLQKQVAGARPATYRIKRHWLLVLGLSVVIAVLFLTPLSDLIAGRADALATPGRIGLYVSGLAAGVIIWRLLQSPRMIDNV